MILNTLGFWNKSDECESILNGLKSNKCQKHLDTFYNFPQNGFQMKKGWDIICIQKVIGVNLPDLLAIIL